MARMMMPTTDTWRMTLSRFRLVRNVRVATLKKVVDKTSTSRTNVSRRYNQDGVALEHSTISSQHLDHVHQLPQAQSGGFRLDCDRFRIR